MKNKTRINMNLVEQISPCGDWVGKPLFRVYFKSGRDIVICDDPKVPEIWPVVEEHRTNDSTGPG